MFKIGKSAMSIGVTPNVVYDEDTEVYKMTSGLDGELGKVVFDIDPVLTFTFNYSTTIEAAPSGSNGYFEARLGDIDNCVTFFTDHTEAGAALYVHHNDYMLSNIPLPNFRFNVSKTMEVNCIENTFIITYDNPVFGRRILREQSRVQRWLARVHGV